MHVMQINFCCAFRGDQCDVTLRVWRAGTTFPDSFIDAWQLVVGNGNAEPLQVIKEIASRVERHVEY
jgi:hypothetical protein